MQVTKKFSHMGGIFSYVWNAKGEDILNKIQRAREAMTSQAGG